MNSVNDDDDDGNVMDEGNNGNFSNGDEIDMDIDDDEEEQFNIDDYNDDDDDDDDNDDMVEIGDLDLDDELALPPVLLSCSRSDKKSLLKFKRSHTQLEWEEELVRRSDQIAKKIDLERLKQMAQGAGTGKMKGKTGAASTTSTTKAKTTKTKKSGAKATIPDVVKSVDDDSDDDLFDSDEEEAIDRATASRSKALNDRDDNLLDDDDDDDDDEEEGEEEEDYMPKKRGKRLSKGGKKGKKEETTTKKKKPAAKKARRQDDDDDDDDDDDYDDDFADLKGYDKYEYEKGEVEDQVYSDEEMEERRKRIMAEREKEEQDDTPEATLPHYLKLQTPRRHLTKLLNEPFLRTAIIGTFVKMSIGGTSGATIYRMCEILEVDTTGAQYSIPNENVTTTVRLDVAIGDEVKRRVKILTISNHRITQQELNLYLEKIRESRNHKPLTEKQIEMRRRTQLGAINHKYTQEEISAMVKKRHGDDKRLQAGITHTLKTLQMKIHQLEEEKEFDRANEVRKQFDKIKYEHDSKMEFYSRSTMKVYNNSNNNTNTSTNTNTFSMPRWRRGTRWPTTARTSPPGRRGPNWRWSLRHRGPFQRPTTLSSGERPVLASCGTPAAN